MKIHQASDDFSMSDSSSVRNIFSSIKTTCDEVVQNGSCRGVSSKEVFACGGWDELKSVDDRSMEIS